MCLSMYLLVSWNFKFLDGCLIQHERKFYMYIALCGFRTVSMQNDSMRIETKYNNAKYTNANVEILVDFT